MNEIIFNNKKSFTDFNMILNYFKLQPPAPKIIKDTIPGMNGNYDFSTVASNGEMSYNDRKISCSLTLDRSNSRANLMQIYTNLLEWLLSGKQELIYTGEPSLKYIAQVEDAPTFDIFAYNGCTLVFEFIAEPFKYGIDLEGDKLWDTFCFETDYLQSLEYDVSGTKTVTIYNPGKTVSPTINVDTNMTAAINNYTTSLTSGDNTDYLFKLQNGANSVQINGTGHIKFSFRKQVL